MAVKMRLRREGKKKQPFYRVVVADVRSPRDGRFIEDIGFYHPLRNPSEISIDRERALYWLRNGVQPSQAVVNLLRIQGIWEEFKPGEADPNQARRGARAAKRAQKEASLEAARQAQAEEAAKAAREKAEAAEAKAAEAAEPEAAEPEAAEPEAAEPEAAEPEAAEPEAATGEPEAVEEAPAEVVEQATEEDTEPDAQPAEAAGALEEEQQ